MIALSQKPEGASYAQQLIAGSSNKLAEQTLQGLPKDNMMSQFLGDQAPPPTHPRPPSPIYKTVNKPSMNRNLVKKSHSPSFVQPCMNSQTDENTKNLTESGFPASSSYPAVSGRTNRFSRIETSNSFHPLCGQDEQPKSVTFCDRAELASFHGD